MNEDAQPTQRNGVTLAGGGRASRLHAARQRNVFSSALACHVHDTGRCRGVEFHTGGRAINIEQEPSVPHSNDAANRLSFYDEQVRGMAAVLKPSARGELEITDLNAGNLQQSQLEVQIMRLGLAWPDPRTNDILPEAGQFIPKLERRQGLKVACPEEIAFRQGWIDAQRLQELAVPLLKHGYGQYLYRNLHERTT